MRRNEANNGDSLKQGVDLEGLQQLSCNVSFTDTPVDDELSNPPDNTCDNANFRQHHKNTQIDVPPSKGQTLAKA